MRKLSERDPPAAGLATAHVQLPCIYQFSSLPAHFAWTTHRPELGPDLLLRWRDWPEVALGEAWGDLPEGRFGPVSG
jgi:hypothetical protein